MKKKLLADPGLNLHQAEAQTAEIPIAIVVSSTEAITISLAEGPCHAVDLATSGETTERRGDSEMAIAIGYVRISKEEAGSMSLATQEAAIRAWCLANGHTLKSVFADEGVSGGNAPISRPGAAQAIREARSKGVEILVVSKLDRMSRDLKDVLDLVDTTLKGKATLVSVSEAFDAHTPAGRMFLQLLGTFGKFERNKIKERTKDALATRRAAGLKTGGNVPYGYTSEGGRLLPLEAEQAVLDRALAMQADGLSFAKIAKALNQSGEKTREGRAWTKMRLYEVLRSETRRRNDASE